MADKPEKKHALRDQLALWILALSGVAILALAISVIWISDDKDTPMTVFNTTLPVFASWVGTVLAFYFQRENFEAANEKVSQMLDRLSPEQRASAPISSIMRGAAETTKIKLATAQDESTLTLADLKAKMSATVSRLPIVDGAGAPLFIVHDSTIDKYKGAGHAETDTLKQMLDSGSYRADLGPRRGFVLAKPDDSIATAKTRMEAVTGCQDIFVTADGTEKAALVGWVSNVRLGKFLQA